MRFMHRIDAFVHRRNVDHMQQQAGARQMAQELVAQAGAFGRTFDQAGNVGDDEALFVLTRAPRPDWGAGW